MILASPPVAMMFRSVPSSKRKRSTIPSTNATYPNNPDSFYSGSASNDSWTYSFTFEVAGNYEYQCNPHADMGMGGTIAVGSGVDGCTDKYEDEEDD